MERWRSVLALAVAGALFASPVLAQTSGGASGQTGGGASGQTGQPSSQPSEPAKPSGSSSPAASPSTTDAPKSDAAKSDTMKKDTMKSDAAKAGAKAGNREQVRAAQQALKDKGHDPGQIDGVMGPKTQAALKDFQKKEGLKETGRLDAETMAKLGVDTAAAASPRGSEPSASPGAPKEPGAAKEPSSGAGASGAKDPAKKPQTR